MTNKEIPEARKLEREIRRNRALIDAINRDGVNISAYIDRKRRGVNLTEEQYNMIEALIIVYLNENIKAAEIEELKMWKGARYDGT